MSSESLPVGASRLFCWVARARGLSSFEKLLYTRMRGDFDRTGACPSIKTLASEIGASPSQVAKEIKRLEELKLVKVVRRRGNKNQWLLNQYRFPSHPLMRAEPQ